MNDELFEELSEVEVEFDSEYKKRRLKKSVRLIIKLIVVFALVFTVYLLLFSKWVNSYEIVVEGNFYITTDEIITHSKIDPSKSIILARFVESDNNLEATKMIEGAIVEYDGFDKITITVDEAPVIFKSSSKYYLKSGHSFESNSTHPVIYFENFEDVEDKEDVLEGFAKLYDEAPEVFEYISQVAFVPDDITKDRLVVVMRDSNKIYLTTEQIYSHLSVYFVYIDKIYSELGDVRGEISFDKGGDFIEY